MTIYTVFRDARKANTEDHRAYSTQTRKESNLLSNGKYGVEKMVCLLPIITIWKLYNKPKALNSQIVPAGL